MMPTTIRWRRRLGGWAGFIGTSRRAEARIRSTDGRISVRIGRRSWLRPPDVASAMRWAEEQRQERFPPFHSADRSWFIDADGGVEERIVEPSRAHLVQRVLWFDQPFSASVAFDSVEFKGQRWAQSFQDAWRGRYGTVEVMLYVQAGADPVLVRGIAMKELRVRAHQQGLLP